MRRPSSPVFKHGWIAGVFVCCMAASQGSRGAELRVLHVSPARMGLAPVDSSVSIVFDRPVNPATVSSATFRVFGKSSGPVQGSYTFSESNHVVRLTPNRSFVHGETILVNLSHSILAADSSPLRSAGYAYQFATVVRPAPRVFSQIDVMTAENGGTPPRVYGALANDFNRDGWVDLAAVNEDAHDIRVFMNRANGTGLYFPFLTPTTGVGITPSPNEPADFDSDGKTDACLADVNGGNFSVVIGNGDGTFQPHRLTAVGSIVRGIAVLDLDGDGDSDIATANASSNNMSLAYNNGAGFFSGVTSFEGGGNLEWGMASGDMNGDGIFDLILGARSSNLVIVRLANGDGTFGPALTRSAGGGVWALAVGDLNGDGRLDVSVANGLNNNGAILLGNGDGTLGPPTTTAMGGQVVSTDLGDWDGDGDLDWVLSAYGSGIWRLFVNNGAGSFSFNQQFTAPSSPSCASPVDFDNDGDLDLVLTDEIADVVILMKSVASAGDADGDGTLDGPDCAPADNQAWVLPNAIRDLRMFRTANGTAILSWAAPTVYGSRTIGYDTYRSNAAGNFGASTCLESDDPSDTLAVDQDFPTVPRYYLVRARNGCGEGPVGSSSSGPRVVAPCP